MRAAPPSAETLTQGNGTIRVQLEALRLQPLDILDLLVYLGLTLLDLRQVVLLQTHAFSHLKNI